MRAEEKMQSWLTSCNALVSRVGDRIEAVGRAQAQEMPNVCFDRTNSVPERDLCGDTGFALVAMTVEVEAKTWLQAREIAKVIRKHLKKKALLIYFEEDKDEEREPTVYYFSQTFQVSELEDI